MNIKSSDRLNNIPKYAFAEINAKVAELKAAGVTPIDFGVGDPSEPTPDFVIEALGEAAKKHARSGYPNYTGSAYFKEECAEYMKKTFSVELNAETEICSNIGSKEAVFNFPEGFINPGDIVLCPSPGYPPYKTGTIFAEGDPYYVPLLEENSFMVDYQAIPDEVVKKARIIWINYPNSPTGAVATREYYEGLIAWANANDIIIAADEGCYIDIFFGERPLSILEVGRKGVVVFYSLSKRNNMTGYRVGFVAGDSEVIEIYKRLKTNIDSGTANFIQDAAVVGLKDLEHVEGMRKLYKEKGEVLLKALKEMGLETKTPEATFYIWQKVPGSDVEFAKKLLDPEIGIVVTPGSLISDQCEYLVDGEMKKINPGEGYVRFALMPTMEEIIQASDKLKKVTI
jgi:LL-diaminopimelate aminotransferase